MEEDVDWREESRFAPASCPRTCKGVFLLQVARAAKENARLYKADTAIARAYGTHSLRRARRTLAYIEEEYGLYARFAQLDGMGRRIVTLVEPARTTAPGNPNADK